jgi:hypothetical protein
VLAYLGVIVYTTARELVVAVVLECCCCGVVEFVDFLRESAGCVGTVSEARLRLHSSAIVVGLQYYYPYYGGVTPTTPRSNLEI